MTLQFLERAIDGRPLLGDEAGFVTLSAAAPELDDRSGTRSRVLRWGCFLHVDAPPADRIDSAHVQFGPPLE